MENKYKLLDYSVELAKKNSKNLVAVNSMNDIIYSNFESHFSQLHNHVYIFNKDGVIPIKFHLCSGDIVSNSFDNRLFLKIREEPPIIIYYNNIYISSTGISYNDIENCKLHANTNWENSAIAIQKTTIQNSEVNIKIVHYYQNK